MRYDWVMTIFEILTLIVLIAILSAVCNLISPDSEFSQLLYVILHLGVGIIIVAFLMWYWGIDLRLA